MLFLVLKKIQIVKITPQVSTTQKYHTEKKSPLSLNVIRKTR